MQGWISLHRKIQENDLWKEPRVFSRAEAWIDILMEVQHDEKQSETMIKNVIITCDRGQSIKSIQTWAERWTWSVSMTRRFLHLLKREKMVLIENLRKTTRLTVCNYTTYQQKRISNESHLNLKRISLESHLNTDNNVNNENNGNNGKLYTLQQVKDSGYLIGFRDPECLAFHTHYNAQGWLLGNGLPIADLSSAMTKWRNNGYKFPDAPKPKVNPDEQSMRQWEERFGDFIRTGEISHISQDQANNLKNPKFRAWAEIQRPELKGVVCHL